jgi:hypothetical protein
MAPDATPATVTEMLAAMHAGVELMCTITNDLLDLEKLRCGKFVVAPGPVPLRDLVESVAGAARPACAGTLTVTVDPGVPAQVLTDGLRLRQILANGLSNACKHATSAVQLRVSMVPGAGSPRGDDDGGGDDDGHVLLRVLDDGPGLRGVDVNRLFDDFSAAAAAIGTRGGVKGSGLGLPICSRLSRLLGGTLTVRDRADGVRGVEFALSLPARRAAHAPPEPLRRFLDTDSQQLVSPLSTDATAAPRGGGTTAAAAAASGASHYSAVEHGAVSIRMGDVAPTPHPGGSLSPTAGARGPPAGLGGAAVVAASTPQRRRRIVIVDDAPLNRRIAERYVHALGYEALLLADGDEVAGAVAAAPADVILMDIRMARVDGDVACRALRAAGYTAPS